ncbi:Oxidoreductase [Acarospora aff. strigata]|nr:Oxidoreductase [Acarospora aff. strigata]
MFNKAARPLLQSLPTRVLRAPGSGRLLSTAPPSQKSRSWKSGAARWALAIGGIYYYNTSSVFAESPVCKSPEQQDFRRLLIEAIDSVAKPNHLDDDSSSLPTLEAITAERRQRTQASPLHADTTSSPTSNATTIAKEAAPSTDSEPPRTPQEYEDEADQQGAFNPETGEINWDCPCLGGMAHGPCGDQFKAAFSCFVFSKEEPKGMDCIDRFKGMQDCFREHPDVYGSELEDDEEGDNDSLNAESAGAESSTPLSSMPPPSKPPDASAHSSSADEVTKTKRAKAATKQVREQHEPQSETDELVPKAAHDTTTSGNEGK